MQWWKADQPLDETVVIWTGYGGGDCGCPFETDRSYLVFAGRSSRGLYTMGICSGGKPLVCAAAEVRQLGAPLKALEDFDTAKLIAREQPYTPNWRSCLQPPLLIGERELEMDKHCFFPVRLIVGKDGQVKSFAFQGERQPDFLCPQRLEDQVRERVARWKFRPGTIDGVPVEVELNGISSTLEPRTEAEHSLFLEREAQRKQEQQR
jgi:hypothetical protein